MCACVCVCVLPEGDSDCSEILGSIYGLERKIGLPGSEPESPAGGGAFPLSYNPFVVILLLITLCLC